MALCDQGYLCDVCGKDVEAVIESDLYLRYVLGEVDPLALPSQRERHIRCNPATAQYIVDDAFEPVVCAGLFAKANLDPAYVQEQEERVSRAWRACKISPIWGLPFPNTRFPRCWRAGQPNHKSPFSHRPKICSSSQLPMSSTIKVSPKSRPNHRGKVGRPLRANAR